MTAFIAAEVAVPLQVSPLPSFPPIYTTLYYTSRHHADNDILGRFRGWRALHTLGGAHGCRVAIDPADNSKGRSLA